MRRFRELLPVSIGFISLPVRIRDGTKVTIFILFVSVFPKIIHVSIMAQTYIFVWRVALGLTTNDCYISNMPAIAPICLYGVL